MSIVLDKVWTVSEYNDASGGSAYNTMLYTLKTTLIAGAWDVVSSCGRVGGSVWTQGTDDYWGAVNEVAWAAAGSDHSWIVLKNTSLIGSGAGFQVCIDCNDSSTANGTIVVSYNAGFTGGTTTNRPTAIGEMIIAAGSSRLWYGNNYRLFMSTDGECTRIIGVSGGCSSWYICFEKLKNAPDWVTYPVIVYRGTWTSGYDFGIFNYKTLCRIPSGYWVYNGYAYTYHDSQAVPLIGLEFYCVYASNGLSFINSNFGKRNNYFGNWCGLPVYFAARTYSRIGIYGCLYDLYGIPRTPEGTYLPSSVNRKGFYTLGFEDESSEEYWGGSIAIGSDGMNHGLV